jgi:putative acetyltransferase
MVGFVLHPAYWGQSIIAEAVTEIVRYAFSELDVDIISGYHYPFNRQSGRVFEKCGFRFEGTLRMSSVVFDGTVLDNVCYSILQNEVSL